MVNSYFSPEGKGPHKGLGYCHQHYFSLEFVAVMMLIRTCHALSGVIVDNEEDEDKSNFLFLLGAGISD